MDKSEVSRPIIIILDGLHYIPWSQAMSSFLKGRKLWRYVTGDIQAPIQSAAETPTEFIRQEPRQSISAFLPQIYSIWDQLTPSEPKWLCAGVILPYFPPIEISSALFCFLWDSLIIYEPVRASLLHRIPLPTLEQTISELLSEETRLSLVSTSHVAIALATPGSRGRGSSSGSRSFSASGSQFSGGSASRPNESDCPNNPTRRDTRPQSTAATTGVSSTASASPTLIDVSDLPALVSADYLSSSSTPPYLTDPFIDLFPDNVDVPADPPDDTLHVAPPSIVYPVESSSTAPAPPVLPPVPLPSDIPVRRSTRESDEKNSNHKIITLVTLTCGNVERVEPGPVLGGDPFMGGVGQELLHYIDVPLLRRREHRRLAELVDVVDDGGADLRHLGVELRRTQRPHHLRVDLSQDLLHRPPRRHAEPLGGAPCHCAAPVTCFTYFFLAEFGCWSILLPELDGSIRLPEFEITSDLPEFDTASALPELESTRAGPAVLGDGDSPISRSLSPP
ncbi:hypothetical protein Acr_22g0004680 [Actinidia rufa]|uniref:Uncharacterized protein n=1 Tax=Actinidia rufa TaxID=165716 RepID=A0A7J0GJU1_9ERIC|nr:hypothetical protein Acr_22g0004680 [Actinidia rufa]